MFTVLIPAIATLFCCQGCCSQQSTSAAPECCPPSDRAPMATRPAGISPSQSVLNVELLALDLDTCDRCTGTDKSMEAAITALRPALKEAGVDLRFTKTVVRSAEQATQLRFQSSPTVRINGRDLPIELRESRCGDCTTLCGGPGGTDCRVWVWRGREYTEAPPGLIVDAVLRAYPMADQKPEREAGAFALPENLRRFFDTRKVRVSDNSKAAGPSGQPCCDTKTCCDSTAKTACCGTAEAEKGRCGCKPD